MIFFSFWSLESWALEWKKFRLNLYIRALFQTESNWGKIRNLGPEIRNPQSGIHIATLSDITLLWGEFKCM